VRHGSFGDAIPRRLELKQRTTAQAEEPRATPSRQIPIARGDHDGIAERAAFGDPVYEMAPGRGIRGNVNQVHDRSADAVASSCVGAADDLISSTQARGESRGVAEPSHPAALVSHQTGGAEKQRGFAASGRSHDPNAFSVADSEIEGAKDEGRDPARAVSRGERFIQAANLESGRHADR
jgi:hypothetical protein